MNANPDARVRGAAGPDPALRQRMSTAFLAALAELNLSLDDEDRFGEGDVANWPRWTERFSTTKVLTLFHLFILALRRFASAVRPEGDYRVLLEEPTAAQQADPTLYPGHRGQPPPDESLYTSADADYLVGLANHAKAANDIHATNGLNDGMVLALLRLFPQYVLDGLKDPTTGFEQVNAWDLFEAGTANAAPLTVPDSIAFCNRLRMVHDFSAQHTTISASLSAIDQVIRRCTALKLPVNLGDIILRICGDLLNVPTAYDPRHHLQKFSDQWSRHDYKLGSADWNAFGVTEWGEFKRRLAAEDRKRVDLMRSTLNATQLGYSEPAGEPANAASSLDNEVALLAQQLLRGDSDVFEDGASLAPSLASTLSTPTSATCAGTTATPKSTPSSGVDGLLAQQLSQFQEAMQAFTDTQISRIKEATAAPGAGDAAPRRYAAFKPRELSPEQQPCKNRRRLGIGFPCPCGGTADPTKGCDAAKKFSGTRSGIVRAAMEFERAKSKTS
ncbi:hypothetical protein THAOC_29170 [Thalassiosira oceanica]|uniref:Uncharacterized protein n=1 Tax=Thalassiosira oceanica TaxID=159749 RepID=K0REK8_THAOC|nr:hypothetical protein THAOC_29170 [Thalassiosira oceanica]|eukprot:EJK51640.1 hypothetical protein THAOC_29170 [Thalassiosira oceanica]